MDSNIGVSTADDLALMMAGTAMDDHETLIKQFMEVVAGQFDRAAQVSPQEAQFFLESANWNLQNAVIAYFDFGGAGAMATVHSTMNLQSRVITDMNIGIGSMVGPHSRVRRRWKVQNSGTTDWPPGCRLKGVNEEAVKLVESSDIGIVRPDEEVVVTASVQCPEQPGQYAISLRLWAPTHAGMNSQQIPLGYGSSSHHASGNIFGEELWATLQVDGTLPTTNQHRHLSNWDEGAEAVVMMESMNFT
eukprot:Clim_evm7s2 gene=Clim_evmTU7s2